MEVVDLIKNADISGQLLSKLIKLRCKEMEEVKHKAELVTTLTRVCSLLPSGKYMYCENSKTCDTIKFIAIIIILLNKKRLSVVFTTYNVLLRYLAFVSRC